MADEKKGAAKEFFGKHGEKIGLAVAALALVAYLLLGVLTAAPDPGANKAEQKEKELRAEASKRHKENDPPELEEWSQAALAPWTMLLADARGATDSGATALPEFHEKVLEPVREVVKPAVLQAVTFGGAEVSIDSVKLTFAVKQYTRAEETNIARATKDNPKGADLIKMASLKVERQAAGSGKWEVLADNLDPVKTTSYVDTKIEPKSRYEYRITATPEPDKLKRPEVKPVVIAPDGPVQTLGIWKLTFTSPSKPPTAQKGMVYVKIEKFEKGYGRIEKSRIQYAGDKIGWWAETEGAEPQSKHMVPVPGGKSVSVDLNTGATLVSIEPTKVTIEVRKCKAKYAGGAKIGCDEIKQKVEFTDVYEILYTDDDGEKKILTPNPRDTARGREDQRCDDCTGRKPVVALPKETPPGEVPKEDPAAVAKQKREAEADKLWSDAQKAETAKNTSQAIAHYEKLLKQYADTDFVAKGKKALIEEKLATLKK
jgi:hypothetical protein